VARQRFVHPRKRGHPLWDGDRDALHVRKASADEAAIFRASREQAIREGELDAGDEDWVAFLVPVTDPTDDGEEEEDEEDEEEGRDK
jgi:hypothetical protein